MKKTAILLAFLCMALAGNAQLLWKVSGNGLKEPSYIIGTHHVAPLSIKDSIAGLPAALEQAAQVYGEIKMKDMMNPDSLALMQQAMVLPGDVTLTSLYTPAQRDSVAAVVKKYLGVELQQLDKLKPAALTAQLSVILTLQHIPGYNPQEQLDTYFQQQAEAQGKKVGALETVALQTDVLYNSQSPAQQAKSLYCMATHIPYNVEQTRALTAAYMGQDIDAIQDITEARTGDDCDPEPSELETLIYGRNEAWAKKMPAIMTEASTLFAVGAAHLPGERGVLQLLRDQGYTVEPDE